MSWIAIGIIILAVLIILPMAVKIVPEYERGVLFRLGRLVGSRGPGLFIIIPFRSKKHNITWDITQNQGFIVKPNSIQGILTAYCPTMLEWLPYPLNRDAAVVRVNLRKFLARLNMHKMRGIFKHNPITKSH